MGLRSTSPPVCLEVERTPQGWDEGKRCVQGHSAASRVVCTVWRAHQVKGPAQQGHSHRSPPQEAVCDSVCSWEH